MKLIYGFLTEKNDRVTNKRLSSIEIHYNVELQCNFKEKSNKGKFSTVEEFILQQHVFNG